MGYFLLCEQHKRVLSVGNLVRMPELVLKHPHADSVTLMNAIAGFLSDHSDCNCVFFNDSQFWSKEKYGYRRDDVKHGLPFKGPNVFTLEEAEAEGRNKGEGGSS